MILKGGALRFPARGHLDVRWLPPLLDRDHRPAAFHRRWVWDEAPLWGRAIFGWSGAWQKKDREERSFWMPRNRPPLRFL